MLALDLFCGGGGAARGMIAAGFEVVGIDIADHRKSYPGHFIRADALKPPMRLEDFDFVWASPPCQRFSVLTNNRPALAATLPDLMEPTRLLLASHKWTAMENVVGAPMRADLLLTGPQVGLERLRRQRAFELSFMCMAPSPRPIPTIAEGLVTATKGHGLNASQRRLAAMAGMGDKRSFTKAEMAEAMGLPESLTQAEIGEAVPPAYAEFIAREAIRQMQN